MAQITTMPDEMKDCLSRLGSGKGAVVVMARLVMCAFGKPLSDL